MSPLVEHNGNADQAVEAPGPGSQPSLRSANERRVVEALRSGGELTQAQIARRTALAPSTISSIVNALAASGTVTVDTDHGGRRGRSVRLAPEHGYVVGLDLGHGHLAVALADLAHQVVADEYRTLRGELRAHDVLATADAMIMSLLHKVGASRPVLRRAAMAVPAPIDHEGKVIGARSVLPGWADLDVSATASAVLGVPTVVDNDANLGALAEHLWGAGRGCANLAYLKLSDGIGCGLVLDGRRFRGATGVSGEIGHCTIDERGALCRCGNRGCLETIAATGRMLALLADTHGTGLTVRAVVNAAHHGDTGCRRVLGDTGRAVGVAVANLCNLVNPDRIVIGGELALAGDLLLDPLREIVQRYAIRGATAQLSIVPAELAARSQLLGAIAAALEGVEMDERALPS